MTTHTEIVRTDDLTGEPAAQPVVFGWGPHVYEIDLADANATALSAALAPFIEAGRVIGGIRTRAGRALAGAEVTGRPIEAHGRIREALSDVYQ
ncbi:Lsr2 dimerization domain-containing protein [Glycomyces sp. MUSA5-2]|uniref:Lsr2 dimerization domain-containing protein n=1 Tax=Glycomyces sp. MUSA5-2 TaxID=2053002 RepID=UPI0030084426